MKLEKILDNLNSFEKNSFLKIIDGLIANHPKNSKTIEKILNDASGDLKAMDSINISKVFHLLTEEYSDYIKEEFQNTTSQIGILTDILTRDGNCIMKQDWLSRLYDAEVKNLNKKIKLFANELNSDKPSLEPQRIRDYKVFKACVETAYQNDDLNNQDRKISNDEQTILNKLAETLGLSHEEVRLIDFMVVPLKLLDIETIINDLKNLGIIFYTKKTNTVYIPDEIVLILRKIKGKKVADKFFRRVLKQLKEPQINMVCRNHNIDWKQPMENKIKDIIKEGISFNGILLNDIHRTGTTLTEKKKFINELCEKKLKISFPAKGVTIEDKLNNLISYLEEIEKDDKVGISIDGYEKLLVELNQVLPKSNKILKDEFELQDENVMSSLYLLDYNIKPREVLEVIPEEELSNFCIKKEIKTRGDIINNILENYKDAENLYLENYESIGYRDLATLKDNGIKIKESEIGVQFEELTKKLFEKLGFKVDDKLRKQINTAKDKIDILLNVGNNEIILVECKSVKESGYNKFSSVSRQLKSYIKLVEKSEFRVIKSLLIAPEFSDDFVKDCGLDYELNLSLITANSLYKIQEAFKTSRHKAFPYNLLMRDVLIQEDRVIKSIAK